MKARVIALYLPQFHPIPENDANWGAGFTEWTNVVTSKPLFKGHYQPRIPADLGFYDLRLEETRIAQAEMAKQAGVEGFCYWHYWFGRGKVVLERPFKEVLSSGVPDYPFCLGWANHSWTTGTWKKGIKKKEAEMIFEQLYLGEEDQRDHFNYVLTAFKDKRYITVDGKPLFYIYNAMESPEITNLIVRWRRWAVEEGLPGIYFVGRVYGGKFTAKDVLATGVDAVNTQRFVEAEQEIDGALLTRIKQKLFKKYNLGGLFRYKYSQIIKGLLKDEDKYENYFPTIVPQFDRSARAGNKAKVWTGSTPELFSEHVSQAVKIVSDKHDEHKIIFLSSWNEWAEGSYVEPDRKFGKGYLNAIAENIL